MQTLAASITSAFFDDSLALSVGLARIIRRGAMPLASRPMRGGIAPPAPARGVEDANGDDPPCDARRADRGDDRRHKPQPVRRRHHGQRIGMLHERRRRLNLRRRPARHGAASHGGVEVRAEVDGRGPRQR